MRSDPNMCAGERGQRECLGRSQIIAIPNFPQLQHNKWFTQ
jgi:hypothetical protein